jgi:16S rRNA (cytidine1402-2'-O)-methyltransferase
MLYLVPTPIGNLEDITMRALNVLKNVSLILAEDTRVTKRLLNKYEIETPLSAFHAHNEHKRLESIVAQLQEGQDIALVSDAGTPGISDPGYLLVREAVASSIEMTCLPGATALVPAVVMSGLPCDKFHYEGFLPQKKGRMTRLKYLLSIPHTFVLYESPHRVLKALKQIAELSEFDRKISISREISKMFEENIRGLNSELIVEIESRKAVKGEIVMIVEGLNV